MSRATIDITQKQKMAFKNYIKRKLQEIFDIEIYDSGETKAKVNLLNNKDAIIDNIIKEISDNTPLIFNHYWEYGSINETLSIINDIYIKTYNDTFRAYKLKQKAQKDYYKTLIYNEFIKDIKEGRKCLQEKLYIIKTQEYKKCLLEDLKKQEEDFNEDLFNELYYSVKNKVVREFKEQLEVENMQQDNSIHIPLGWKVYGISKAIGKIFKI